MDELPPVDLSFADRAVYLVDADALVIADVHLGRGAASAVDAPIDAAEGATARLASLVERFEPGTVVVAGDLLHSFSFVPHDVRETVDAFVEIVDGLDADIVFVRGNHDTMIDEIVDGAIHDQYRLGTAGETVVAHGHVDPNESEASETSADTRLYVVGHDHPALSIDGRKRPCFLYGPGVYTDGTRATEARSTGASATGARTTGKSATGDYGQPADVLVLPAFSRLASGTTINRRRASDFQSPLITDVDPFHPIVRDVDADETLWFPRLGDCRELL